MVPFVQDMLLDSLKTLCGIDSLHALPALWCSEEALMRLVGCKAQQGRQGVCQRGAATRHGPCAPGPICPEAWAENIVTLRVRDLEALCKGGIDALAQTGVLTAQSTGMVDAPELETTAPYDGGGHVTRQRQMPDTRGQGHESAVTVDGWQLIVLRAAHPKLPLAATVGPLPAHAMLSWRALVTPARTTLAGHARRHTVVFDRGCWAGVEGWWLAQHGLVWVVPAKEHRAVTGDARAPAAAGDGGTVGRRAPTGRHGQGRTAWSERLETAVVGLTGLTTDAPYGAPEPGRQHHRRDCQPNALKAVVVRTWHNRADGPGGNPVFLTKASVETPVPPFDADEARRLSEHGGIKESQQPWRVQQPPQQTARAVRGPVILTGLMCAWATAYRRPGAPEEAGAEPIGWPRWRRQRLEQTRDQGIVWAPGHDGLLHLAEYSLRLGAKRKEVPPGIGTLPAVLARSGLTAHG